MLWKYTRPQLASRNQSLQVELAFAYSALASLHSLAGPPEKTLEYADKAIPIFEAALGREPANEDIQSRLRAAYLFKAKALGSPGTANLGDSKGALDFANKARAIVEKLAANHPAEVGYQFTVGVVYNLVASLAGASGNEKQALEIALKSVAIDQRLVELEPANTTWRTELAIQTGNAGSSMLKLGDNRRPGKLFKGAPDLRGTHGQRSDQRRFSPAMGRGSSLFQPLPSSDQST